jgi:ubiquitin-protein ligase
LDLNKFAVMKNWKNTNSIETILMGLKNEMANPANKKLA